MLVHRFLMGADPGDLGLERRNALVELVLAERVEILPRQQNQRIFGA